MVNSSQQWTAWKDLARDGGTPPAAGAPAAPVLPTAVTAVAPGIEGRFRALVKQIKSNANYNESIGENLGIEGAVQTGPDLTSVQPQLDASISGNRVEVDWGWNGNGVFLDICEIQVDRGDGKGFVFLTFDTMPGYVDTAPFPAAPGKWTYKAIYRVGDSQSRPMEQPGQRDRGRMNENQIHNPLFRAARARAAQPTPRPRRRAAVDQSLQRLRAWLRCWPTSSGGQ